MVIAMPYFNRSSVHITCIMFQALSALTGTGKTSVELSLTFCMCTVLTGIIHQESVRIFDMKRLYKTYCYRKFYIIKGLLLLGIVNKIHNRNGKYNWFRISRAFWNIPSFEVVKWWEEMMHSHVIDEKLIRSHKTGEYSISQPRSEFLSRAVPVLALFTSNCIQCSLLSLQI